MTITAQTSKTGPYNGNGTTTVFSYTFEVQDEAHLVVTLADAAGIETVQVLNTDYTVSGVGNPNGGQITMSTAPASGYTLTISRNVPIMQEVDLENRRSIAPEVLEDAYDKLTQIAQDFNVQIEQSLRVSTAQDVGSTVLSNKVTGPTLLGFDAANRLITYDLNAGEQVTQAADITIADAGDYYAGTTVEVALQEAAQAQTTVYTPAGSGAAARSVQDRLRDRTSFKDFGAVGDGVTDDSAAVSSALATGFVIDGLGLTYLVTSLPSAFQNIKNAAFKVGYVTHVTDDFLPLDTAKVTNAKLYAAWPQDSSYVVTNQIRMWAKYADSHTDPDVRAALWTSDDGGVSWQEPELLNEASNGEATMCAGTDGTNEYVFTYQYGSATYWMHKRTAPVQGSNFYGAFTKTSMTIPKPSGFTADPLYVHSFASNSTTIALGVTSGDGAWLIYSTDQGANWTAYALDLDTDAEEPTVKWWAAGNKWVGFIRAGTASGNPQFYTAPANFGTAATRYAAPATFFGANKMADSPIPLVVDGNKIYAFGSYRNGTDEGNARDKDTSAFYITADLSDGENIWTNASTNNYRLGNLIHTETGGASAVGVGSVVKYEDKIFLLYSQDERTGDFPTTGSTAVPTDRVANIYQTVIPLSFTDGVIDFNNKLISDRSANNPFVRRQGGKAWMAKEGRWLFSMSGQLSDSYSNANASAYNDFIVDLYSTSGGVTVATDSVGKCGFVVYNDYGTGDENGLLVDGSNGNLNFYIDGTERFRWNESALSLRPNADDAYALGGALFLWSEVFAGTGTINTSDANLKEQVADLDAAELAVAQRIKGLIKKFKFKNAVEKKGDDARIHVGVLAQDVKAAFEAEGLDAHAYGMFCENTETDENGTEVTRLGVRYSELLAFVIAAM